MKTKKSSNSIYRRFLPLMYLITSVSMLSAQDYELVWSDEFNYTGKPDPVVWNFEEGFKRNRELQWYQDENAYCRNGFLVIEARQEKRKNPVYKPGNPHWAHSRESIEVTSSSITTSGKKEFLYGRFEIKARIPVAGGSWPAIWTLGNTMEWPSNGEIDIMEYYRIKGVPHILANAAWGTDRRYLAKWDSKTVPFTYFTDKDPDWASKFHIWRMDWDETSIKLYLDDELLNEIPLSETINGALGKHANPFKQPHYLLLNLAIGGDNGGEPDFNAFPLKYEIDYVRVYQKEKKCGIRSGQIWPDDKGVHVNAHGGGMLFHDGKYYWFGEHKSEKTSAALVGVTCYSSSDLVNWTNEGVALPVSENLRSDIVKGCVMERPKVIYNDKTGKFVMWFHLELKGEGYKAARAAVAVSDTPAGPYRYLSSGRVNAGIYPENMPEADRKLKHPRGISDKWWTPEWYNAIDKGLLVKRDLDGGQMSRDMTLFTDDDGKAYHIYSSEENLTLHIAELSDDYLSHSGRYIRIFPGGHNEAPAIFKKEGTYWMITSGCTGWDPNEARMFSAPSIWGPWKQHPNPCVGENAKITFGGQSTFTQPLPNGEFMFMADIWRPKKPIDARYIWLPIQFSESGTPYIKWIDAWNPKNEAGEVHGIIRKVNDYWQSAHPDHQWAFWHDAAYHTGNLAAYETTGNEAYKKYSEAWAERNEWKGAKSDNKANWKYSYGETDDYVLFGDWQICFQVYADLYNTYDKKDERKIARAREVMEYQMATPNTDYWWWADGLYMVMPVMTKLYNITGNRQYLDKLYAYFAYARNLMYDSDSHLFYRDAKYIYPKHQTKNREKDFWSRGNGWVFAGLAKVLTELPEDDPHREEYIRIYRDMAKALAACQQEEGFWTRSLLDTDHAPGYETSGTAFFTFGYAWGVNNGFLDKNTYKPVIDKSWKYLTHIALQPDGKIGYVQPIGERADQHKNVGPETTADFGVGAFLLAASEMVKYLKK